MKASEARIKGAFNNMGWSWQPDGSVIITLLDTNNNVSGKMRYSTQNGELDQLLEDSEMEAKT